MDARDIAIKVENVSKCYRIGLRENLHDTFGAALFDFMKSPLKNYRKYRSLYNFDNAGPFDAASSPISSDIIWALRNVTFEVKPGEVLGVIGRNGAGKSTLLKILSRITAPTWGRAEIRGRISSLLEVGTGFHSELTGRENVYLNGTVLGMRKKEIDRRFDEIVDFSGVEQFIDTPIKRYSSGMTVRLAFSVAAHLDPEILIIDEVLAVGDSEFQKKCLGKMHDISSRGRTVLFVSHNMGAVSELCDRCILISKGAITADGKSKDIVNKYLSSTSTEGRVDLRNWTADRGGEGPMQLVYLDTRAYDGQVRTRFSYGEPIDFTIGVSGKPGEICILGVSIRDVLGNLILHFSNTDDTSELSLPSSESEIHMRLPENILNDGTYYVTVWLGDGFNLVQDVVRNCLFFIVESPAEGQVKCASRVRLPAKWKVTPASSNVGQTEDTLC
jgi:lipopolysaccharide transport system ATP-binding protein